MKLNIQIVEGLLHRFVSLNRYGSIFFFFVEDIRVPTKDSLTGKYKDNRGTAYDTLEDFLPESICVLKTVPDKKREFGCKLKDLVVNFKILSDKQIKDLGFSEEQAKLTLMELKNVR